MSNNYTFLAKLEFDGATQYLTTSQTDDEYDSNTYQSGYMEINASTEQSEDISTKNFSVKLSAIDQTFISLFTSTLYKNRIITIYRAALNDINPAIIDSVQVWYRGEMDKFTFVHTDKTTTMTLKTLSSHGRLNSVNSDNLGELYSDVINDNQIVYWQVKA